MATAAPDTFAHLLETAINEPGLISSAYGAFHNYSLGNQLLALAQCMARGITPGPIATFQGWKEKGRWVRKGEKALTLCRPVTVKRATPAEQAYLNNFFCRRRNPAMRRSSELIRLLTTPRMCAPS